LIATSLAVPTALASSDLIATLPRRRADCRERRERRERRHAITDRFRNDRVDGLAPPRLRPILVPNASYEGGGH